MPGSSGRVTPGSCSSLGLLWSGFALRKSPVLWVLTTSTSDSNLPAWDTYAKAAGGRCDQSQQKEGIARGQARGIIQGSASGLSYKAISSNLHQNPTVGNVAAAGNGAGILACLRLRERASLCPLSPC